MQVASGVAFTIVPYISFRAFPSVMGITSAGGQLGGVILLVRPDPEDRACTEIRLARVHSRHAAAARRFGAERSCSARSLAAVARRPLPARHASPARASLALSHIDPQLAFFTTDALSYADGLLWSGLTVVASCVGLLFVNFPMWGGMLRGPDTSDSGLQEEDYYLAVS